MDEKKLGQRIKAVRLACRMTQGSLAESVGLTSKYISNIENGCKTPSFETFLQIANALEVDANTLLDDQLVCKGMNPLTSIISSKLEKLPREQQEMVLRLLDALIERLPEFDGFRKNT